MSMCNSSLLTTSDQSPRCSLAVKFLPGMFKVLAFPPDIMKIYAYLNSKSWWLVCLLLVVTRPPRARALEYLVLIILASFLLQRQSTMTRRNLGEERVYLVLHFHITVHHPGKPRQELKAGIWKQELKQMIMEECCLLPCSPRQPSTNYPGLAVLTEGWTIPHQ